MDTAAQDDNFYNKVLIDFFEKNPKYNNILTRKLMNGYIKSLIEDNKYASRTIAALEQTVANYHVTDEKSKVNFGNLCTALTGFRLVEKATSCLLINENVLKGEDGEYYQKIEDEEAEEAPADNQPANK